MGWLSWLRPIGDVVAAPFTGGASLADLASSVPNALSGDDSGDDSGDASGGWGSEDDTGGGDPSGGGMGSMLAKVLKGGAPVAAGALKAGLSVSQLNKMLQEQQAGRALTQSTLDPFRGEMDQSRDMLRLDMANNGNFAPTPTQVDPKYGAGLNVAAMMRTPYTPNSQTRNVLTGAMNDVASGAGAAPNYADPANRNQPLPLVRVPGVSAPPQAAMAPGAADIDPITGKPRRLALGGGDDSPWLQR